MDNDTEEPGTAPPDPVEGTTEAEPGPTGHRIGERIGPYSLLSVLGEGGFGVVYLAEQTEPVKRRVALKVIKPGMDSAAVIARFEQERQALAVMDHHNVARVLDAGTTDRGLPYFVMEHVKGEPITAYCDRQNLTIRDRLGLFIPVCEAVQHAHMKGIIHRDIKPSNVLVAVGDGGPAVKVIDFGVAKAISHTLTQKTIFTEHGQLIGTPEYMSPEQAEMGATDIDTRTDVYSLGVLLYELLTGATPFDSRTLRNAGLAEIQRMIREVDPPKPSTRFSGLGEKTAEVAEHRQARREELARELSRELDWIPLKAMRKDRTERYRTATDLSDDIRNYLNGLPLEAGPESAAYRLRKFVRRNRVPVGVVTALVAVLAAGVVGTAWGMQRTKVAEAEAQRRAEQLEKVAAFQQSQLAEIDLAMMGITLRQGLIEMRRAFLEARGTNEEQVAAAVAELDASLTGVNFTNVALKALDENIFDRALIAIHEQFEDEPQIKARLLQTLATTLRELGLVDRASEPQVEALDIRRRVLGDKHPDTLTSIDGMGRLLQAQGRLTDAEPYYREALETRRRVLGDDHPSTLISVNNMGFLLKAQGKLADAEPYWREALETRRRLLGDDHPHTLLSLDSMGLLLQAQGRLAEADPYYREALEGRRRVLGGQHPETLNSISNVGFLLQAQGRLAEAEPYHHDALEGRRRALGDDHPHTLLSINNMGYLLHSQGRFSEAERYWRESLERYRRVMGNDHPDTMRAINNMGALLYAQGKFIEAETFWLESLEGYRRILGSEHSDTLRSISNMASLLYERGEFSQAESYWREALAGYRSTLGTEHPNTLSLINNLGFLFQRLGRFDEAEMYYREALDGFRRTLGNEHPGTLNTIHNLGWMLRRQGLFEEAVPYLSEAVEVRRRVLGKDHIDTLRSIDGMVGVLRELERFDEAATIGAETVQALRAAHPEDHRHLGSALEDYARTLIASGRFEDAEACALEAADIFRGSLGPDHRRTDGVIELLAELYEQWHKIDPDGGHHAKAAQWRAKLGDN